MTIDILRFKQTLPTGGVPMYAEDWVSMQEQMLLASMAMYRSLGSEVILSGLTTILSNTYPSAIISSISEGYVLLGGDMYNFPGRTNINKANVYLVPDTSVVPIQRTLKSGNNVPVIDVKRATIVDAQPSSGPYIKFSPFPSVYLNDLIALKSKKIGEIITFSGSMTGSNNVPLFQSASTPTTEGLGLYSFNGFALCNGKNGTADLRGRFIVGMDPTDPDYQFIANNASASYKGGEKKHKLIASELAQHTHSGTVSYVGDHSHNFRKVRPGSQTWKGGGNASDDRAWFPEPGNDNATTSGSGGHSHSYTTDVGAGLAGTPHENRPPYYTLAFIQRIF